MIINKMGLGCSIDSMSVVNADIGYPHVRYAYLFFNNSDAILNFENIAVHCGLSRVILLFWTAVNKI